MPFDSKENLLTHLPFQAMDIAPLLHKLDCRFSSIVLRDLTEDFSLQLMHQKIQFSPENFFTIRVGNVVSVRAIFFSCNRNRILRNWRNWNNFNVFAAFGTVLLLLEQELMDFWLRQNERKQEKEWIETCWRWSGGDLFEESWKGFVCFAM